MCELVRHVRQLGHEKIAYVNIKNRFLSPDRKQGYCDSMTGGVMGKSLRSDYIIGTTDYSYESGVAATQNDCWVCQTGQLPYSAARICWPWAWCQGAGAGHLGAGRTVCDRL